MGRKIQKEFSGDFYYLICRMSTAVPPSLKALKPYLQHAKQTQKVDPLVAYYCE